jgi:hypothetical protein
MAGGRILKITRYKIKAEIWKKYQFQHLSSYAQENLNRKTILINCG